MAKQLFHRLTEGAYGILKAMKGGQEARGFTILETLIVLAVTGGLFVIVAVTLSGRQARTQFSQSVQEVRSQIQEVINEVAVGYYPNANNFTCTATLTGPSFSSASPAEQGTNTGCVFLGKAIQFRVAGTDPQEFNVFSIAGLQRDSSGNEVTSYVAAKPEVVPYATEKKKLLYGLSVEGVAFGPSGPAPYPSTIAFMNSLGSYNGDSLVSGSQQVKLLPVKGGTLDQDTAQGAAAINNYLQGKSGYTPDADANPNKGVFICFVSGGTNQSGLITIGNNGRQLSVKLNIRENRTCT